ncbi:hypothetical protein LEP1GSC103_4015 [Leptospira borgpetersenii serovar Javanica str. UI 09931]|uniref:Uncharacterized protein n=4 Tax=Leptospira borgpetersenii TaxID=174 RepID=M3FGL7_LEPBO|nr:hypothetical protein C4Q31_07480 [Leptospira borgpetersenii serovar Ceylonica]EKP12345.1 hypothetical protein LEP1GSC128_4201 [Leptospira borgpetersenii str. 200801926]EKQ91230.1 hypothetical protein LEP1GSC101_1469 [Leptospira borgpetersenii str. UI 09149]EMG00983.1 hypothetical protein LEP1GSC123_3901 [Leptospira borgpetersenii str. 200701203]EMK10206.1 hypothetical protein LEP1GSC066_3064 [Leptospira sp. serovar Kenya str. Sh9]EMN11490.1 hypothetical protein LEP1GSC055_1309 [Leptospira b
MRLLEFPDIRIYLSQRSSGGTSKPIVSKYPLNFCHFFHFENCPNYFQTRSSSRNPDDVLALLSADS